MAQAPVAAAPAAQPFRVGDLELVSLRDGGFIMPNNGSIFGLNASPKTVAEVLRAAGAPTDTVRLDVDCLLLKTAGRRVLFDTGLGPTMHGALPGSLALAGVSPAAITDVLITHAHGDHVGGLLDAEGRSAFPNAKIRLSTREWAFLQSQADTKALAAVIAPQVVPFEPGQPILPGVTPIAHYGHTPGHVAYLITSRGETLEDIGDTAHSAIVSLARPDWTIQFDTDKTAGAAQRRRELQRLAAAHTRIYAPHFPFPGVGVIESVAGGFRFKPAALDSK